MTREEAIEIINKENDPNDKKVWELFPEYREALDMAIQASRDMEEIAEIMRCDADAETKCKMISNILTAKPHYFEVSQEPKWIPVNERLPENGTYFVTVERIVGKPGIDIKSFAKDLNKVDEFDFPKHKSGWYDYDSEYGYWEDTNVIAWMPLPKLYEPQESEE